MVEEEMSFQTKYGILCATVKRVRQICDRKDFNIWQVYKDIEAAVFTDDVEEAVKYDC